MGEVESEQPAAPVEPETEPEVPFEEPDTQPQPEPEPESEPEPQPEQAVSDREIEAIYKKLDTRAANYIKSASEIVGDEGVPLEVCEMCKDAYPGLRWREPQDELHAHLIGVVAEIEQGAPLKDDPNAEVCHVCDGFGIVKLPSHVPENQMRMCRACNGSGFRELNPQSGAVEAPAARQANGNADLQPGVPPDDPVIADLRARGYTVMAPMHFDVQDQ